MFHFHCIPMKLPQVFHSHLIIFFVSLRSSLIFTPLISLPFPALTSSAACVAATSRTNSSDDTNIHLPLPDGNVATFSFDFIFVVVVGVAWATVVLLLLLLFFFVLMFQKLLRNVLSRFPEFVYGSIKSTIYFLGVTFSIYISTIYIFYLFNI